jgi:hypothetical protein
MEPIPMIKVSSRRFESAPPIEPMITETTVDLHNIMKDFSENSAFSHKNTMEVEAFRSFMDDIPGKKRTFARVFNKFLNNLFENPEGRLSNTQRAFIVLYSMFEVYRVIISSYLIVFVPQNCDGYSCTILQNFRPNDNLEIAAISINSFMALYFVALFSIEFMREKTIRKHLIPDKEATTDKVYLIKMLTSMNSDNREEILWFNNIYRIHSHTLLVCFFVNVGVSCTVIYKNYLNNTTVTVFITNALFMINRIHKALKITSSGEYNIYSAYRTDSMLYNRDRDTWLERQMRESNAQCV